jgi:hypothetical protein
MVKLRIEASRIKTWARDKCNDCEEKGDIFVKYPKFKKISVCLDCYRKYYSDKVQNG